MKYKIGECWRSKNGVVIKIVSFNGNELWPIEAELVANNSDNFEWSDQMPTYSKEGIYSSKMEPSDNDLYEKITKEENPEYYL